MKFKKVLALLLAITMMFSLAACGGNGKTGGDLVAKVGDISITEDDLHQYMYLYCFLQGIDLRKASDEEIEYIKGLVLEDYIALNLIKIEYADKPDVLPEDFENTAKEFVDNVATQEQAAAYMKENGISDEYLIQFYEDQHYSMEFFKELTEDLPQAGEEEARVYYDENQDQFKIDEVTASHILVKEEELAKEILAEIKDGGDFAELAKEHSIDGSAAQGGSLGTFGKGAMVKEFEDAAFALKPGETSDLVETEFGYHIIHLEEKHQGIEEFEDAKQSIIDTLNDEAIREAYSTSIEELREKYGVEYMNK